MKVLLLMLKILVFSTYASYVLITGMAQVSCYSGEMCLNDRIGQFSTPQDCCMVDNALSFESGDCENCFGI